MSGDGGKRLYEALDDLNSAVEGTTAEASFDYLVDRLLRACLSQGRTADKIAHTVGRWQALHRPLPSTAAEAEAEDL